LIVRSGAFVFLCCEKAADCGFFCAFFLGGVFNLSLVAPLRSSAARAALRSTRLLLHLFRASHAYPNARDRLVDPTRYRGGHQRVARACPRNNWPETNVGAALCCEAPRGRRSTSKALQGSNRTLHNPPLAILW
jgi:hypothetical protein